MERKEVWLLLDPQRNMHAHRYSGTLSCTHAPCIMGAGGGGSVNKQREDPDDFWFKHVF